MAEIDDIKYEVAVANRILAAMGLRRRAASLGHTSMRVPSDQDKFVVKVAAMRWTRSRRCARKT